MCDRSLQAEAAAAVSSSNNKSSVAVNNKTCMKCKDPNNKAVICSRDGPSRGGYCPSCFRRYIGWSLREAFFRHCGMLNFLQQQDSKELTPLNKHQDQQNQNQNSLQQQQEDSTDQKNIIIQGENSLFCPTTKIVLAVSGSFNSMAMLIQFAEINKELTEKYNLVTQNGKKPPVQGKSMCVRPMELFVVHLTRRMNAKEIFSSSSASENNNNNNEIIFDEQEEENNLENACSLASERKRAKDIFELSKSLGIDEDHIIIQKVEDSLKIGQKEQNTSSSLIESCYFTGSNKAVPLSTREDIYRCLIREGLVNISMNSSEILNSLEKKNYHNKVFGASAIILGNSATSSSWLSLSDVTRGRGASLFESCGLFCEISSSSSTSSVKVLRPLVGISSRELVMYCKICCGEKFNQKQQSLVVQEDDSATNTNANKNSKQSQKEKQQQHEKSVFENYFFPQVQNCNTSDNPTSYSPDVPSIDRALEDFVMNMMKNFASTSFNVNRSVDKIKQIQNYREETVSQEVEFLMMHQKNQNLLQHENYSSAAATTGTTLTSLTIPKNQSEKNDDDKQQHQEKEKIKLCSLCLFSESNSNNKKNVNNSVLSSLCTGCELVFEELQCLATNQPSASAKQASSDFLSKLENYVKDSSRCREFWR